MVAKSEELKTPPKPWYKQATPFLVFAGPAAVVVASLFCVYLAFSREDDLVTQNYYQSGQSINERIHEDAKTRVLGLDGKLTIDIAKGMVSLVLDNPKKQTLPPVLSLDLQHPTQEKLDQHIVLSQLEPGQYQANLEKTTATRWHVTVQNQDAWRLEGEWEASQGMTTALTPAGHSVAIEGG